MVHYKLNYFNFKGRAEIIRYVFALANQEYEDFGFTGEQWKQTYMAQSPLGSAPWLEIHDGSNTTVLGQSITITRYLARKFGLAGKDELEQAEVEMYADQVTDFKTAYQTMSYESDQTRKAQLAKKFHEATEPAQLAIFENRLAKTGSGFFAPSGLTYADLMLTLVVELVVAADRREQLLARFPLVKKLIETVNAYPAIAARK